MVKPLSNKKLQSVYDAVASRYDWQHAFFTLRSDQRGRELVVSMTVKKGGRVLDAGAGTGTTALMAAEMVRPDGRVVLYDFSEGMLKRAKEKASKAGLTDRLLFHRGDMAHLPYSDDSFDVALSTYSMCPLNDPAIAAAELYRVVKPEGKIGVAHSTEPSNFIVKKLAAFIEKIYWRFPQLSLGCRAVEVLPTLQMLGGKLILKRKIGVPFWPFLVSIIEKPSTLHSD